MPANLFTDLAPTADERFDPLLAHPGARIERIVSHGHASPPGFWYDQPQREWVIVLRGRAHLRFADEMVARDLGPGDHVDIAPHRRHCVEWTTPDEPTVWLAVHLDAPPDVVVASSD